MRNALQHKESEFSALPAEYYRMTNKRYRLSFDTDSERGTKRGELLITVTGSPSKAVDMTRAMITTLLLKFLVVAAVHIVLSLNLCGYKHHLL